MGSQTRVRGCYSFCIRALSFFEPVLPTAPVLTCSPRSSTQVKEPVTKASSKKLRIGDGLKSSSRSMDYGVAYSNSELDDENPKEPLDTEDEDSWDCSESD
ncbi:hypothetical protein FNV43_RR27002 [Rhamnella rubrinervis]|uniref:Uncharacterized protein n=1 Tax=Rhamnella rubrinervis TaxID=2594499 RepID=A0A8K0DNM7_9ROSA|nr:hypothetical protein FNV43_RR27002 [Rhamnella rubrinervis]